MNTEQCNPPCDDKVLLTVVGVVAIRGLCVFRVYVLTSQDESSRGGHIHQHRHHVRQTQHGRAWLLPNQTEFGFPTTAA